MLILLCFDNNFIYVGYLLFFLNHKILILLNKHKYRHIYAKTLQTNLHIDDKEIAISTINRKFVL